MNTNTLHYLNGEWVSEDKLLIPARDNAIVRGYGVSEKLRTYRGKPFYLKERIERLFMSAAMLSIPLTKTHEEIEGLILEGLKKNSGDWVVQLLLTGGVTDQPLNPENPNFAIIYLPISPMASEHYEHGISIITYPAVRAVPEAKSTDYLTGMIALQKARELDGSREVLYIDPQKNHIPADQKLYEGAVSNFFAMKNGELITATDGVLKGITRLYVLKLADDLQIPHVERDIFVSEIPDFEEAFMTGTVKEVLPVVKIDGLDVGDGKVGIITKKLIGEFKKLY